MNLTAPPVTELQKGSAVPPPQATASDANGDYVVVWTSDTVGAAGVYAKVYPANWTQDRRHQRPSVQPTPAQILVTSIIGHRRTTISYSTASYASVACDAAGDFVVTWSEQDISTARPTGTSGPPSTSANGNPLLAPFMVNTTTADVQEYSAVAMDADGDFVITWQSLNQDGSGYGIYAQRYDSAGNPLGGQDDAQ